MSIITALKNLPPFTELDLERIQERLREKEVVKRRLARLCSEYPRIGIFIRENLNIFNGSKGQPRSFDLLDSLLMEQSYRLSYWSVATEEINYRRFFDINSLAAIRVEKPEVFDDAHKFLLQLINEGAVTGLRIDHPDGLYNPSEYFEALQQACFTQMMMGHGEEVVAQENLPYGEDYKLTKAKKRYDEMISIDPSVKPFYIIGEKILTKSERMPEEWRIFSTTGYVFLNSLNGIFVETRNAKEFERIYSSFVKEKFEYADLVSKNKKLIMEVAMTSEINTIGRKLSRIAKKTRYMRDFTLNSLIRSIVEAAAHFPVYRSYINGYEVKDRDRQHIEAAVAKAKRRNPAISSSIFDYLRDVLLLKFPDYLSDEDKQEWLDFAMRFQQLTGPIMAKGVEDTTFYVYNRLVSLNEVGGSPERFGTNLDTFHGQNMERSKFWPHAMITTNTHDTKRSEDVRARINVLSEIPFEWKDHLVKWRAFNKKKKIVVDSQLVPDRNEEYLLYQTLIGTWPLEFKESDNCATYIGRIKNYMIKAVREAKVNSSWINPNLMYEDAMSLFLDEIMQEKPENDFIHDFEIFQRFISACGMYNSLSQTLLKIVSPGVPDFYQGSEIWDFSLVDPDNRKPVDYGKRMAAIQDIKRQELEIPCWQLARKLTDEKHDGRVKLFLIYRALNNRKRDRAIYEKGEYRSLHVLGRKEYHVCALARRLGERAVLAAAPRFFMRLLKDQDGLPLGEDVWHDTVVEAPADGIGMSYKNIFTEEVLETAEHDRIIGFRCGDLFRNFPVALLEKIV
jgi:(1->4)-alpha-D-glucan 1-alpha-D-glucosylmutase